MYVLCPSLKRCSIYLSIRSSALLIYFSIIKQFLRVNPLTCPHARADAVIASGWKSSVMGTPGGSCLQTPLLKQLWSAFSFRHCLERKSSGTTVILTEHFKKRNFSRNVLTFWLASYLVLTHCLYPTYFSYLIFSVNDAWFKQCILWNAEGLWRHARGQTWKKN